MSHLPPYALTKYKKFYSKNLEIELKFKNKDFFSGVLTYSRSKLGLEQHFNGFHMEDDSRIKLAFFAERLCPYSDSPTVLSGFSGEIFNYNDGKSECLILRWLTITDHVVEGTLAVSDLEVLFDGPWKNERTEIDMIRSKICMDLF